MARNDLAALTADFVRRNPKAAVNMAFEIGFVLGRIFSRRSVSAMPAIVSLAPLLIEAQSKSASRPRRISRRR